jgi:hypothetical protein
MASELSTATEIATVEDGDILPIRKAGVAGLLKVSILALKTALAGIGTPVGGTGGQVLAKVDNVDHNTHWIDQTGGGGGSGLPPVIGNSLKVLTVKADESGVEWDAASGGGGGGSSSPIGVHRYWGLFNMSRLGAGIQIADLAWSLGGVAKVPANYYAFASYNSSYGPNQMLPGVTGNAWADGGAMTPGWVYGDFTTAVGVDSLAIIDGGVNQVLDTFMICYSDDATNWKSAGIEYLAGPWVGTTPQTFIIPTTVVGGGSGGGAVSVPPVIVQSKIAIGSTSAVVLDTAPTVGNLLIALVTHYQSGTQVTVGWTQISNISNADDFQAVYVRRVIPGDGTAHNPTNEGSGSNITLFEVANATITGVEPTYSLQVNSAAFSVSNAAAANNTLFLGMISTTGNNTLPAITGDLATIATLQGTSAQGSPRGITSLSGNANKNVGVTATATWAAGLAHYGCIVAVLPVF